MSILLEKSRYQPYTLLPYLGLIKNNRCKVVKKNVCESVVVFNFHKYGNKVWLY